MFIHWNAVFVPNVSNLTNTQLHNLQNNYILAVLNKMGFPCTYSQAVVIGPTTHGGIGSIDLQIEQGIMIINKIMRITRTPGRDQDIL